MKYEETYYTGIKITDMNEGDIIYVKKMHGAYDYHYECSFVSFAAGIVTAKVIKDDLNTRHQQGRIITARLKNCYLFGKDASECYARCHWFGE